MPENDRFLDHTQRAAALRALEDEFDIGLTEAEVLQAARLFFSLVASSALVNANALTQEVGAQLSQVVQLGQLAGLKSTEQARGTGE